MEEVPRIIPDPEKPTQGHFELSPEERAEEPLRPFHSDTENREKIETLKAETEQLFDSLGREKKIFKTLSEIAKPGYQYRAIGADGFRDLQESGILRANQDPKPVVKDSESGLFIKPKHFRSPFFISDAYISTIEKYNPEYVAEVPKMTEEYVIAGTSGDLGNVPWDKNDKALPGIAAKYATIYKKGDGGYQKIDI